MRERDILVVEDEPVIAQAVLKICALETLSVDMAENGNSGLALMKSSRYRLVLCDIMMPDMDGFQFLAKTARMNLSTPVIMATGYSTLENAVKSLACGAIDFIPKPFTTDELLTVVHRGLKYSKLQKEALIARPPGKPPVLAHVPCPPKYYRFGYVSWAKIEPEGTVLIGVSDLFLKTIDDVRGIVLAAKDDEVAQGGKCAEIVSAAGFTHRLMCPVSGRIMEANAAVASNPSIAEKDPYFSGWLYRILPSSPECDLKNLIACSSDRL